MPRVLARSPGTISRELLCRNASPAGDASASARSCAQTRRRRGRPTLKLDCGGLLFAVVRHFLRLRRSAEQIALTLAAVYPKGHEHRVSHETIDNCLYAQPVGELERDSIAPLRHARDQRVPRSEGQDRRGQIPDMPSMQLRPPEVEDRLALRGRDKKRRAAGPEPPEPAKAAGAPGS